MSSHLRTPGQDILKEVAGARVAGLNLTATSSKPLADAHETVTATTGNKRPGSEARLLLYNEHAKVIAECRARRVGGELVADPRPGSREQALCARARAEISGVTLTYSYPSRALERVSARTLEATAARHH